MRLEATLGKVQLSALPPLKGSVEGDSASAADEKEIKAAASGCLCLDESSVALLKLRFHGEAPSDARFFFFSRDGGEEVAESASLNWMLVRVDAVDVPLWLKTALLALPLGEEALLRVPRNLAALPTPQLKDSRAFQVSDCASPSAVGEKLPSLCSVARVCIEGLATTGIWRVCLEGEDEEEGKYKEEPGRLRRELQESLLPDEEGRLSNAKGRRELQAIVQVLSSGGSPSATARRKVVASALRYAPQSIHPSSLQSSAADDRGHSTSLETKTLDGQSENSDKFFEVSLWSAGFVGRVRTPQRL